MNGVPVGSRWGPDPTSFPASEKVFGLSLFINQAHETGLDHKSQYEGGRVGDLGVFQAS